MPADLRDQYEKILGYLPQDFGYYPEFTAYDFLLYLASLKGLARQRAREDLPEPDPPMRRRNSPSAICRLIPAKAGFGQSG